MWPFITGDCFIEVTLLTSLIVFIFQVMFQDTFSVLLSAFDDKSDILNEWLTDLTKLTYLMNDWLTWQNLHTCWMTDCHCKLDLHNEWLTVMTNLTYIMTHWPSRVGKRPPIVKTAVKSLNWSWFFRRYSTILTLPAGTLKTKSIPCMTPLDTITSGRITFTPLTETFCFEQNIHGKLLFIYYR